MQLLQFSPRKKKKDKKSNKMEAVFTIWVVRKILKMDATFGERGKVIF